MPLATRNVNFTGSVDRDLLKRAKIVAAQFDTSVNALFNTQLRYLVETVESADEQKNTNYSALLNFSLGRLNYLDTLKTLRLDSKEDLFLLMAQAHLPMPRLPQAETGRMKKALRELLAN
ncbi:MAG: hypothetical protein LBU53_02330 [Zoogloeaceae bacterium]|jgi:hypothetical protein|nr:hypothetical protein [Zoogloeaceae bacterium]